MISESTKPLESAQEKLEEARPMVSGAVSNVVLAAIGAVGLASDSVEHLLHRMVERGEMSRAEAKKMARDMRSKRPHLSNLSRRGVKEQVANVLNTSDLASKTDIQALNDQVAALNAKIDQLTRARQETANSGLPTPPKTQAK